MNLIKIDELLTRYGLSWADFEILTQRHGYPNLCSKQGQIHCDSGEFARWVVEIKMRGCESCDE